MMTPDELQKARAFVAASRWTFSKTMPQWPHHWTRVEDGLTDFKWFCSMIETHGEFDSWNGKNRWRYLVLDGMKYWCCESPIVVADLINRAEAISNAEMIARGKEWMKRNNMKSGPYGRPILIKPTPQIEMDLTPGWVAGVCKEAAKILDALKEVRVLERRLMQLAERLQGVDVSEHGLHLANGQLALK
jgi:hypothetical protein